MITWISEHAEEGLADALGHDLTYDGSGAADGRVARPAGARTSTHTFDSDRRRNHMSIALLLIARRADLASAHCSRAFLEPGRSSPASGSGSRSFRRRRVVARDRYRIRRCSHSARRSSGDSPPATPPSTAAPGGPGGARSSAARRRRRRRADPVVGSIIGSFARRIPRRAGGRVQRAPGTERAGRVAWGALIGRVVATGAKVGLAWSSRWCLSCRSSSERGGLTTTSRATRVAPTHRAA